VLFKGKKKERKKEKKVAFFFIGEDKIKKYM
jgi:hypothetical protein